MKTEKYPMTNSKRRSSAYGLRPPVDFCLLAAFAERRDGPGTGAGAAAWTTGLSKL
jgi:hypothetical protein